MDSLTEDSLARLVDRQTEVIKRINKDRVELVKAAWRVLHAKTSGGAEMEGALQSLRVATIQADGDI